MKKTNAILPTCALVLTSLSCAPDSSEVIKNLEVKAKENREYLYIGETIQLVYSIYGVKNNDVTFESSNNSILTVDKSGLVTAVGAGEALISVKSVEDTKLVGEISFTVANSWSKKNEVVSSFVSSVKSLDYASGVNLSGDININLGKAKIVNNLGFDLAPTIPYSLSFKKDDKDFKLLASLDVSNPLSLSSSLNKILPINSIFGKEVAEFLSPNFEDYLNLGTFGTYDYTNIKKVDIYSDGSLDYYPTLIREDDAKKEIPFAIEKGNITNYLSLIDKEINRNDKGNEFVSNLEKLLTKDSLLKTSDLIYSFVEEEKTSSEYTILKLNDDAINFVNNYYETLKIGGPFELNYKGINIDGLYLPNSIDSIKLKLEINKDKSFKRFDFYINGVDSSGAIYNFLNFNGKSFTNLESDEMDSIDTKFKNYYEASKDFVIGKENLLLFEVNKETSVKALINEATDLYKNYHDYVITSNEKLDKKFDELNDLYANSTIIDDYKKDLLYPMYHRLTDTPYGTNKGVNFIKNFEINNDERATLLNQLYSDKSYKADFSYNNGINADKKVHHKRSKKLTLSAFSLIAKEILNEK